LDNKVFDIIDARCNYEDIPVMLNYTYFLN